MALPLPLRDSTCSKLTLILAEQQAPIQRSSAFNGICAPQLFSGLAEHAPGENEGGHDGTFPRLSHLLEVPMLKMSANMFLSPFADSSAGSHHHSESRARQEGQRDLRIKGSV
jgi:hypothetical protein